MIYLSAVDYALDDQCLVEVLTHYRDNLTDTGQMILISASYHELSRKQAVVRFGKDSLKSVLDRLGLRSRGQFWGWMRTGDEYLRVMAKAGFLGMGNGFIKTDRQHTYWVGGKLGQSS